MIATSLVAISGNLAETSATAINGHLVIVKRTVKRILAHYYWGSGHLKFRFVGATHTSCELRSIFLATLYRTDRVKVVK